MPVPKSKVRPMHQHNDEFDIVVTKFVTVGHVTPGDSDLSPIEAATALIGKDIQDTPTGSHGSSVDSYRFEFKGLIADIDVRLVWGDQR